MGIGGGRYSQVSFADLVELYSQSEGETFNVRAKALGFEKQHEELIENSFDALYDGFQLKQKYEPIGDNLFKKTPPSQTECSDLVFYYVAHRERTEQHLNPQPRTTPQWFQDAEPLTDDEIYDLDAAPPRWKSLTRKPKLWGVLRQQLKQLQHSRELDVPRFVQLLSRGESIQHLPLKQQNQRIRRLYVLADYATHLTTMHNDYAELYHMLKRHWGADKVVWQNVTKQPLYTIKKRELTLDTVIIVLSDCGTLGFTSPKAWQRWLNYFKQKGLLHLVLAPASAKDLQTLNIKAGSAYSWDQALKPMSHAGACGIEQDKKYDQAAEILLTHLAFTYRIEPGLLRAMRLKLGFSVSVEAQCRSDKGIEDDGYFLYIKDKYREVFHQKFKALTEQQQRQSIALVKQYHASLPRSILDQEIVHAQGLCLFEIPEFQESLGFMQRLSKTLAQHPDSHLLRCCSYQFLQDAVGNEKELNAAFFAYLYQQRGEQPKNFPRGVDLERLSKFVDISQASEDYTVEQVGRSLVLVKGKTESLNSIANLTFTQQQIEVDSVWDDSKPFLPFSIVTVEDQALLPKQHSGYTFDTGTERLTLLPITKPDWADNIGRDRQGLFVECEHYGKQERIYFPACGGTLEKDKYGIYFDLSVRGVVQRFRWIAAGSFMMGSPEDEEGRFDDEDLHHVTLAQGYWLADTACTQELWQVVMGNNPSEFDDSLQNPVETVSWLNVRDFLSKLNQDIFNLKAYLPTDAQWEYACRAGTATPFSFGENVTSDVVNFKSKYFHIDGNQGKYRKKTIPVKVLPANQWGLYQMHGNVWEWCSNEYHHNKAKLPINRASEINFIHYSQQLLSKNINTMLRIMRGGSWEDYAAFCRSSSRKGLSAARYHRSSGFRIALS